MPRVNTSDLADVLLENFAGTGLDDLTPFINTATRLVDRVAVCASNKGITLTDEELADIEKYLAAHFYTQGDPLYRSKRTADAEATFSSDYGYDKIALAIDPSGCLKSLLSGGKNVASAAWLGKPYSERLRYDQRN